jgi:hypothetical protein
MDRRTRNQLNKDTLLEPLNARPLTLKSGSRKKGEGRKREKKIRFKGELIK